MHYTDSYHTNQLALLLQCAIAALVIAAVFFLVATFVKRNRKLIQQQRAHRIQQQTDALLFELLFGDCTVAEAAARFQSMQPDRLTQKIAIKSIIGLHRNYAGEQKALLEAFFVDSALIVFAERRVQSRHWKWITDGVRILTTLHVEQSADTLLQLLHHPHERVRKEALIGMFSLRGTACLNELTLPQFTVDDWTQSCILHRMKIRQFHTFEGVERLFASENESLIVLGARIIDCFQIREAYSLIPDSATLYHPGYRNDLERIRQRLIFPAS